MGSAAGWMPSEGRCTAPRRMSWGTMRATVLEGMAKLRPVEAPARRGAGSAGWVGDEVVRSRGCSMERRRRGRWGHRCASWHERRKTGRRSGWLAGRAECARAAGARRDQACRACPASFPLACHQIHPPVFVKMAVLTPITAPDISSKGPPLFPGLTACAQGCVASTHKTSGSADELAVSCASPLLKALGRSSFGAG